MIAQSIPTLIESVLLTKVQVKSQIVCSKMHHRGNVKKGNMGIGKKGNMGIGKSLNQCMRVIWVIDLKRKLWCSY